MQTSQATISVDDVATVSELFREIGQDRRTPEDFRDAAIYWSAAIDPDIEPADLQTIVWLLGDVASNSRVASVRRDQARYWATYLTGRMQSQETKVEREPVKRYGCHDCGGTWTTKNQVPARCQPYTVRIKKNPKVFGGYEMTSDEVTF